MHSFLKSLGSKAKANNHNISSPTPVQLNSADQLGRLAASPSLSSTDQLSHQLIHDSEFQLIYGYIGLYTEIELDILTTSQSVNLIARELKSRALETPLLFSTHALDISTEVTHSLIRTFVHNQREFFQHLPLHGAHNLAALLKWILSRHVNSSDTHGFLKWNQYSAWRDSEPTFGYPLRFLSTHLLSQLSHPVSSLLSCLLDLFTSASLRADVTGMTVHKCATLFGSYIFGLEHDQSFEHTYNNWLRYSHATEHLIFAHMRDLKAQSITGKVPLRMENYIKGYPSIIPSLTAPHPSARLETVARFRKITPHYNPNLVASAGTWKIARSKTWDRLKPYPEISAAQYLNNKKAGISKEPSKLLFSQSFKHLLNIGANFPLHDDDDNDLSTTFEGPQRFKSLVEKEWSGFMARGFQAPDAKKLQFNLEESFNAQVKQKRETMDWASFSDAGFIGRETYRAKELEFNSDIQKSCTVPSSSSLPASKRGITKKLMKTVKSPSVFSYDTTPCELPSQSVDDNFFEAWADVLVASGWCRDEPKESSWVLLHCKCKAVNHQDFEFRPTLMNPDGRNEEMWTLFEEVVPQEHQPAQQNASKLGNSKGSRRSFLRAIINKDHKKSSSTDKMTSIPEIPPNFFPGPTDSLARWANTSQSSIPQTFRTRSSFELSATTGSIFTSQASPMEKIRSLSRKMHGHGGNIQTTANDPIYSTDDDAYGIDTESMDSGSPSEGQRHRSEKWVNVFIAAHPQTNSGPILQTSPSLDGISEFAGFSRHETDYSRSYDQPIHYISPSSNERRDSSRSSGGTQTSDPEDVVHGGPRFSDTWRSTDSSDFTVETVERLAEPPAFLGVPSLVSIKNINHVKHIAPSNRISNEPTPHPPEHTPLHTFTSRHINLALETESISFEGNSSTTSTANGLNKFQSFKSGHITQEELEEPFNMDSTHRRRPITNRHRTLEEVVGFDRLSMKK